jgi:hypothetical protein
MVFLKIKSQIKSPFFNVILKISKSSQNDLKSDFVKLSIKSLNTLHTMYIMNVYKCTCKGVQDPRPLRGGDLNGAPEPRAAKSKGEAKRAAKKLARKCPL